MHSRRKLAITILIFGSLINFGLATTKLFIGLRTNSISILSDSANNYFDILSCFIVIIAFAISKKKTKKYPFGTGRAEYLAAFVISLIVCIIGLSFVYAAATRLMMPVPVWFSWLYFGILVGTVFIKLIMAIVYKRVNTKIKSDAVKALMLDSYLDAATTSMVIIGFILMEFSGTRIDSIFGIITGIMILSSGIKLMFANINKLIGRKTTDIEHDEICKIFAKYSDIKLIDFELHDYGIENNHGIARVEYASCLNIKDIKSLNDMIENTIKEQLSMEIKFHLEGSYEEK